MAPPCHSTAEGASVGKAMKNIQAHVKDLWHGFVFFLCAVGYSNGNALLNISGFQPLKFVLVILWSINNPMGVAI